MIYRHQRTSTSPGERRFISINGSSEKEDPLIITSVYYYIPRVGEPLSSNQSKTVINFIIDDDSRLLRDIERHSSVSIEEMFANVAL